MNRRRIVLIALVSVFLLSVAIWALSGNKEIEIQNKKWSCENEVCQVSFDLINATELRRNVHVSIRSFMSGRDRWQGRETGIKQFTRVLGPRQTEKVKETVEGIDRTRLITVNAWVKDTDK